MPRLQKYGDVRDLMTDAQLLEYGRLVARVKKMARRAEQRKTETAKMDVIGAVHELMVLEDRVAAFAQGKRPSPVTVDDLLARIKLMTSGAGLELAA